VKPVLIYSMSVSVDGFSADHEGAFGWTAPKEALFRSTSRRYASSAAILALHRHPRHAGLARALRAPPHRQGEFEQIATEFVKQDSHNLTTPTLQARLKAYRISV
jgi:hypothetical protein